MNIHIEPLTDGDRNWVRERTELLFGGEVVVTRGKVHDPASLPGFVAWRGEDPCGIATYRIEDEECELVTLDVLLPGRGIGTGLLGKVEKAARAAGAKRLWLVTSNDNLEGLRFYQLRGLRLVAVHRDAIDEVRRLKPGIPRAGRDRIPIHDEIELEKLLA